MIRLYVLGGLVLVFALLIAGIGVQTARLNHAKHDLAAARAELKTAKDKLTASETNRSVEYQNAVSALSEAEKACSDRVAEARASAQRIHRLTERPLARDPKTNCPLPGLLGHDELQRALQAR